MSNNPKAPQAPNLPQQPAAQPQQQQRSDVDTKKTETKESVPGGEVKTTQTEEHRTDRDSRRE